MVWSSSIMYSCSVEITLGRDFALGRQASWAVHGLMQQIRQAQNAMHHTMHPCIDPYTAQLASCPRAKSRPSVTFTEQEYTILLLWFPGRSNSGPGKTILAVTQMMMSLKQNFYRKRETSNDGIA